MLPVDAAPFLGDRPPDTALSLADSGTLKYDEDPRRPRLSRDARIDRWRRRLPLLDEDPRESELDRVPPGEEESILVPSIFVSCSPDSFSRSFCSL